VSFEESGDAMIYKTRPLPVTLKFEDRPYRRGQTIDVTEGFRPDRKVGIPGVKVELVLEERLTKTEKSMTVGWGGARGLHGSGHLGYFAYRPDPILPSVKTEQYVHSAARRAEKALLEAGETRSYRFDLRIAASDPRHLRESKAAGAEGHATWTFHWKVRTTVDVRMARDAVAERPVVVVLE